MNGLRWLRTFHVLSTASPEGVEIMLFLRRTREMLFHDGFFPAWAGWGLLGCCG